MPPASAAILRQSIILRGEKNPDLFHRSLYRTRWCMYRAGGVGNRFEQSKWIAPELEAIMIQPKALSVLVCFSFVIEQSLSGLVGFKLLS
jgi:hypothetical protein